MNQVRFYGLILDFSPALGEKYSHCYGIVIVYGSLEGYSFKPAKLGLMHTDHINEECTTGTETVCEKVYLIYFDKRVKLLMSDSSAAYNAFRNYSDPFLNILLLYSVIPQQSTHNTP